MNEEALKKLEKIQKHIEQAIIDIISSEGFKVENIAMLEENIGSVSHIRSSSEAERYNSFPEPAILNSFDLKITINASK